MNFLKEFLDDFKMPSGKREVCIRGKHHKQPFKMKGRRKNNPLELIHMDVNGPMPESSIGGHSFFVTFIDDFTKMVYLYLLKKKSNVFQTFCWYKAEAENQTWRKIKAIRSDDGGEFDNQQFDLFSKKEGIIQQKTIAYNPQQNGVAERYNRTIMERVRCMLIDANLDGKFWAEDANTAVYLINCIPKKRNETSAYEKWTGEQPKINKLRIFGERGFVYIPKEKRRKLDDKSEECMFVDEECNSLMENETWELTELPDEKAPIKCKWVYAIKRDQDGKIIKYKARLVAKGFSQIHGVDYNETFAPVVKYTSIRMLLAIATNQKLQVTQLDAVTAFLNGELEEKIYMEQPILYEDGTKRYCRLKKSIYGLKQASRVWNRTLDGVLTDFGLEQSKTDQYIYFSKKSVQILYLAIYVDDILIFTNDTKLEQTVRDTLSNNFKMKYMGESSSILGIRIQRDVQLGTISIGQTKYIDDMLHKFNMTDCKSVLTPLEMGANISKEICPKDEMVKHVMKNIPYREAIGSLLFLTLTTRPDISFAVNFLSRYCEDPGMQHWSAVKRIFRYL